MSVITFQYIAKIQLFLNIQTISHIFFQIIIFTCFQPILFPTSSTRFAVHPVARVQSEPGFRSSRRDHCYSWERR